MARQNLIRVMWALLCLFGTIQTAQASEPYHEELMKLSRELGLAQDRHWLTLLHYRPDVEGFESFVDSPDFFLAGDGKTNPQAELDATLRAFLLPTQLYSANQSGAFDPVKEHPQCRFRARFNWLKSHLGFDSERMPEAQCDDFLEWREAVSARSATLIFAGAYVNNPASMFGHTFLRLDRGERGHGSNLTSYAVNYAAEPWTDNPLIYTVLGLTGGFDAYFSVLPFYLKEKEYSDLENRDLWEYELLFTDAELERMVEHIWEIQPYSLDYYYLDENCSFHLLSLFEVARPSLKLTENFTAFAIPADTLRVVIEEPGLVGERTYRSSRRSQMLARRYQLRSDETPIAKTMGSQPSHKLIESIQTMPVKRQAAILDAAISLWTYRKGNEENPEWGHLLLRTRGRLGYQSPPVEVAEPTAPEAGHGSSRIGVGGGIWSDQKPFINLEIRPSLHDLVAPDAGYNALSQIEFLNTTFRLFQDGEEPSIQLQSFKLLSILSLAPLDAWDLAWSWGVETGVVRLQHPDCDTTGCLAFNFELGFGGTWEFGAFVAFLLLDTEIVASDKFDYNLRLGLGPRLGLRLGLGEFSRLLIEARYRYPILGENFPAPLPDSLFDRTGPSWMVSSAISFRLTKDLETRLSGEFGRGVGELNAKLYLHW